MNYLTLISIASFFSCQSRQGPETVHDHPDSPINDTSLAHGKPHSLKFFDKDNYSFLDSVANKYELSVGQIRTHTQIDSVFYSGSFADVSFTGDTVFDIHNGLKGAIIVYDDGQSCLYKVLLVMTIDNKNVSNKFIYSDCDRDEGRSYITLDYKLLNDSVFETYETYFVRESEVEKMENLKWKISNKGEIQLSR
jgi:hypothetical protein